MALRSKAKVEFICRMQIVDCRLLFTVLRRILKRNIHVHFSLNVVSKLTECVFKLHLLHLHPQHLHPSDAEAMAAALQILAKCSSQTQSPLLCCVLLLLLLLYCLHLVNHKVNGATNVKPAAEAFACFCVCVSGFDLSGNLHVE